MLHTYSSLRAGSKFVVGTYNFLDMAPKGRDEDALPWSMAWVRRHDELPGHAAKGRLLWLMERGDENKHAVSQ